MRPLIESLLYYYQVGHRHILQFAEKLTDEQLHWRPTPEALPIAFHLWHVARWADYTNAVIPGMTPELSRILPPAGQIWEAERLAERWGFADDLGAKATGMQMGEEAGARLKYPGKDELLDYARKAFAAVEASSAAIPPDQMEAVEQWQPITDGIWGEATVGEALLDHVGHDNRHLGAMEALLGLQTGKGSSTV
ncbi:MAG: DinB family protein [Caldilineaceae bacterium]